MEIYRELTPEERNTAESALKLAALMDALTRMHIDGKVDLKEINGYFREAVGQLRYVRMLEIISGHGLPLPQTMGIAQQLLQPNYELFNAVYLEVFTPKENPNV